MPKTIKKSAPKKSSKKTVNSVKTQKPSKSIGVVTHFYGKIKVAIVKFKKPITLGVKVSFRGATTDFDQIVSSMQFDHEAIKTAPKGKEVGIKVSKPVRQGDEVYFVEEK